VLQKDVIILQTDSVLLLKDFVNARKFCDIFFKSVAKTDDGDDCFPIRKPGNAMVGVAKRPGDREKEKDVDFSFNITYCLREDLAEYYQTKLGNEEHHPITDKVLILDEVRISFCLHFSAY